MHTITIDPKRKIVLDWSEFSKWVKSKYAKTYSPTILCYVRKYHHLLYGNLRELDTLTNSTKTIVVKSLVVLSKYLGIHKEFKERLANYGVKLHRQNSFDSFLRILNANNNDKNNNILNWIKNTKPILTRSENVFIKFCLYSGLRKSEAVTSFNKIIELNNKGLLDQYYDKGLNCLMHFKYPEEFIRKTKNCFISFIPEELIKEICNCKPISYRTLRRHLKRNNFKCRINELRDYYGTYLLRCGILEVEINLLQGRIPPSIFVKHYWSPRLTDLRDRVFKALQDLKL